MLVCFALLGVDKNLIGYSDIVIEVCTYEYNYESDTWYQILTWSKSVIYYKVVDKDVSNS